MLSEAPAGTWKDVEPVLFCGLIRLLIHEKYSYILIKRHVRQRKKEKQNENSVSRKHTLTGLPAESES